MKPRSAYAEKLLDPRWQKKRLELLESANWECVSCGDARTTLHVHHTYYERNANPWDYPNYSYRVLCENCHASEQEEMAELQRAIGRIALGFLTSETVRGFIDGHELAAHTSVLVDVDSCEYAAGIGYVFGVDETFIHRVASDDGMVSGERIYAAINELNPYGKLTVLGSIHCRISAGGLRGLV